MYGDTFWSCIEVTAWSQQMDHEEYLELHKRCDCKGKPLYKECYEILYTLLDKELELNFQESNE